MIVYPKTSFANAKAKQLKSSITSSIFWLYLMLPVILIGQAGKQASRQAGFSQILSIEI